MLQYGSIAGVCRGGLGAKNAEDPEGVHQAWRLAGPVILAKLCHPNALDAADLDSDLPAIHGRLLDTTRAAQSHGEVCKRNRQCATTGNCSGNLIFTRPCLYAGLFSTILLPWLP